MAQNEKMAAVLDLRGLDLVTPVDLLSDGRTPFSKNFRLYAQQADDRRVAVSSRKGPGFYINPLAETLSHSNTAVLGASTAKVGIQTNIHAQPLTAAVNARVTRIDVSIGSAGLAAGPVLVEVYDDDADRPGKLLSTSSLASGEIASTPGYVTARFVNAVKLESGANYWIVLRVQDDGFGEYTLSTTTDGAKSWKTDSTLSQLVEQTYGFNYRLYTALDERIKGAYRFERDNGANVTLVAAGTTMYRIDESTKSLVSIATGLNPNATRYRFANGDNKVFWVNGYDTLRTWNGTTTSAIIDSELPILRDIVMHKDRLFGVPTDDPNKLVWSENPGNPAYDAAGTTPTTATEQWYYAWLSINFWYVPRPHNGSPITGMVSFQDSLTIFTQDKKYTFSGYDNGNFFLRESTGSKGAISNAGIAADANHIYFVSADGFYRYNGSSDEKISQLVNPLFDACGHKENISVVPWKNEVRFYLASQGQPYNDTCLIHSKDTGGEWMYDTETYVQFAIPYLDADDNSELIEFSSLVPTAYLAEQGYNSLGAPIDFEYRLKYDSMGAPAQKKRIRRFYPILQGVDTSFNINLSMDKDFEDSPRIKQLYMETNGSRIGQFNLDEGVLLSGDTSFRPRRQSYSGYAYYWQLRVARKGVNNRVAFIGAQFTYKTKRL